MSEFIDGKPPTSFWVVAGAALAWNLIGLMIYYMGVTASPEQLADYYSEAQLAFVQATPKWAIAANATAVTAGVLACLLLLLRKAWAIPLFGISLVAVIVQDIHGFVVADGMAVWGAPAAGIAVVVLVVAIGLVFYSRAAKRKGWIR